MAQYHALHLGLLSLIKVLKPKSERFFNSLGSVLLKQKGELPPYQPVLNVS